MQYTKYNVNPAIKRYIKYLEKKYGRTCRSIGTEINRLGQEHMYANFCKNYDKLVITLAYKADGVGWVPMEIGK